MLLIDKWLVNHYYTKKDEANMFKYLEIGRKAFPDDPYWLTFKLDYVREKGDKKAIFDQYEKVTAEFPKNPVYFYNYGVELYQYASDTSTGKRPVDADSMEAKARQNLQKALDLQPDYAQASLVLGQIIFNQGVDLQAQVKTIKGKTPEDIKKRADLRVAANKKFDESVPYFEMVDKDLGNKGKLKQEDKTTLRNAYDLLTTIYEQKKIQDKLDFWQGKYNDVDKVH
jgi:tetratricopeptide (TPR) repeat protein